MQDSHRDFVCSWCKLCSHTGCVDSSKRCDRRGEMLFINLHLSIIYPTVSPNSFLWTCLPSWLSTEATCAAADVWKSSPCCMRRAETRTNCYLSNMSHLLFFILVLSALQQLWKMFYLWVCDFFSSLTLKMKKDDFSYLRCSLKALSL